MAEALITKTDIIEANSHVSTNIDTQVFDTAINDAQILDIQPILGSAFYLDVVLNGLTSPIPSAYSLLLSGTDYVNDCGDTVRFYGLKVMITHFATARLMENLNNFYTRAGAKFKNTNQSQTINTKDLQSWINNSKSKAIAYQEGLMDYLKENESTFTIWSKSQSTQRKSSISLRTSKIYTRY